MGASISGQAKGTLAGILSVATALAWPIAANAQTTASDSAAPASGYPAGQESSDTGADIIVTAQKRSERLIDVPISISAISQATLTTSGTNSIATLTKIVPGVVIDGPGFQLTPTIRGIGASALGAGIQSNIAIYIDGVYQADQSSSMFDLGDVSDIEVLKGPQGTLFGRNATGGAILIKTKDPVLGEVRADVNAEYGRYDDVRANGYVSLPLGEKAAISGAATYRYNDGWIRDERSGAIVNNLRTYNARLKLLVEPTDRIRLVLSGWASQVDDPTGMFGAALNGNSIGKLFPDGEPIASERNRTSSSIGRFVAKSAEISARAEIDLDFANLSSISAYHRDRSHVGFDLDSSYTPIADADFRQRNNVFSQEVNLSSKPGSRLTYTIGAFYLHQNTGYPSFAVGGATLFNSEVKVDAIAGYVDGSYKLGRFSILGGLRYSYEKLRFGIGEGTGPYTVTDNASYNNWSPRIGLSYAVADRTNIYATYSKGFKSGQFNLGSLTETGVRPETVDAFEAGLKTAGGPFTLSAAGYYYEYKDIQLTAYAQGGATVAQLFNAARARIYGADVEATARIASSLDVRLAAAWTHARYTEFTGAPYFTPTPNLAGNIPSVGNASGNPMIRAPNFTLSGSLIHQLEIGSGKLTTSIMPYWSSRVYYSFSKRLSQPSYFTVDARVNYALTDAADLYIYGRNLTDKTYATFQQESNLRDLVTFASPRTYGIGLRYRY